MKNRASLFLRLVGTTAALAAVVFSTVAARAADADQPDGRKYVIDIASFKYNSEPLKLRAGDTVTWINRDIVPHTATAKDKSWDSGTIKSGKSKSVVITKSLEGNYYCRFHPRMKSTLEFE